MSRIRDITVLPLQYTPREAYGSARGLVTARGGGLVLLDTEDGVQGIGEVWGPPGVARAYLELIKPFYTGSSVFAQRGAAQMVLARLYHAGTQNQMTALLGAIDIAAHDAMGKLLDLSVAELIGGRLRERIPVYASGGYFTAADDQDAALARQLEAAAPRGFGAFKIKIGHNPAEDARRCALARRIIGDAPLLTVDTNGNYTEDGVLESMRRTADCDIHWYEEPLAPQDWSGYRSLAARAPVRLATGEALYTVFDFRRLIDGRLAAVVQPDLTLCGGFDVARTIGVLCAAEHLRISPHVWGAGVGLVAALHFLAALPAYPHADHVPFPPLLEYDVGENALQGAIFAEPVRYADGCLDVPRGPGLGVALDMAAVRRFGGN
ncbi:MAG TPA: mandelate racemase/muconate lactonizing enzyme family protein [Acetobacteraceae bacterium]|nr:mandelate racemase/muconate lactonizing enzyme family protein [Acetobacteraceae bacterium]